MRVIDAALWLAAILFAILALLMASDLATAIGAPSCTQAATSDCYPWEAEGSAAEYWFYRNKQTYMAVGFFKFLLAGVGLTVMILSHRSRKMYHRLIAVSSMLLLIALAHF